MLLEFRLNAATLADESSVNNYMMGSLELPQSAVIDAMCMNGDLWFRDYTLDPTILVANSSRLYRVAEVVDDGFDPMIAAAIEGSVLEQPSQDPALIARSTGVDPDVVTSYIRLTSQQPDSDVAERFVIFAVRTKLRETAVIFLDRRDVELDSLINRSGVRYRTLVPTNGLWEDAMLTSSLCRLS